MQTGLHFTPEVGTLADYEGHLVNTLALDYLSLTEYGTLRLVPLARRIFNLLEGYPVSAARSMQYKGETCNGVFLGRDGHGSDAHTYLRIPGLKSEYGVRMMDNEDERVRCTRFDLQVTVPAGDVPDMSAIADMLQDKSAYPWNMRGKPPGVNFIRAEDGYSTIYVGNRKGDLFRRIYVKCIDGIDYVRLEVEAKGNLARELWRRGDLLEQGSRATFFRAMFGHFPTTAQSRMYGFMKPLSEPTGEYQAPTREEDQERALAWWINTVVPAYKKAASGPYAAELRSVLALHGLDIRETNGYADLRERMSKEG